MKKLVSLVMTIAILLSLSQAAWAAEEVPEIDTVATSNNVIVVVPGIIGSELVDGNGAKVWVGVGAILGQIQCSESGNPVYPLYVYNNDNYGANDTYNGYYETMQEYEIRETEGIYELSTGVDAQELPNMTVNNEVVIEPSVIFDNFDVQRLNSD